MPTWTRSRSRSICIVLGRKTAEGFVPAWASRPEGEPEVNPTAFGGGMPVFGKLDANRRFRLVGAQPFDCGIVALHYQPHGS